MANAEDFKVKEGEDYLSWKIRTSELLPDGHPDKEESLNSFKTKLECFIADNLFKETDILARCIAVRDLVIIAAQTAGASCHMYSPGDQIVITRKYLSIFEAAFTHAMTLNTEKILAGLGGVNESKPKG